MLVPHPMAAPISNGMDRRKPAAGERKAKVMDLTEVTRGLEPERRTGSLFWYKEVVWPWASHAPLCTGVPDTAGATYYLC